MATGDVSSLKNLPPDRHLRCPVGLTQSAATPRLQFVDLPEATVQHVAQYCDVATLRALRATNSAYRALGINHAANQHVAQALRNVSHGPVAVVRLFGELAHQHKLAALTHVDLSQLSLGDAATRRMIEILGQSGAQLRCCAKHAAAAQTGLFGLV